MIDPTFKNINRLFVLSFKDGNNAPTKDSSDKYYIPLVISITTTRYHRC